MMFEKRGKQYPYASSWVPRDSDSVYCLFLKHWIGNGTRIKCEQIDYDKDAPLIHQGLNAFQVHLA
jgi:hypothetical protein